ncbi:MAG: hypothetical protein QG658_389 [Patescibacteria group bacterium]|nr:hypothetical protein [Patescibacteria group bacterium]
MQVLITCWQRRFDSLEWDEASCRVEPLSYICSQVNSNSRAELEIRDDEITISYISDNDVAYYRIEVAFDASDREEVIQRLTEAVSPREVVR